MSINVLISRISLALVLFTLCACGSTKEMILLQTNPPVSTGAKEQVKTLPFHEKEYKLRPNDRLTLTIVSLTDEKVNFLKEPQIEKVIDAKGQIELPVMGEIKIAGLNIKQAEDTIKAIATDYLRSPNVTIKLMSFYVTVLGEVHNQGSFLIPEPRVNLLEAIGQAGGLTENANLQNVRIIRNESKSAKVINLNLLDEKALSSNNFFLEPNDLIVVNPRKSLSMKQERMATIGLLVSLTTSLTFLILQILNK